MSEYPSLPVDILASDLLATLQRALELPLERDARQLIAHAYGLTSSLRQKIAPPQDSSPIDRSVFDALMTIAGDDTVPRLLRQVLLDLDAVSTALDQAFPARDWPGLRMQSHILMSIAGSFGATGLYRDAETLNRLAHKQEDAGLPSVERDLLQGLELLVRFLQEEAARRNAGPRPERPDR